MLALKLKQTIILNIKSLFQFGRKKIKRREKYFSVAPQNHEAKVNKEKKIETIKKTPHSTSSGNSEMLRDAMRAQNGQD